MSDAERAMFGIDGTAGDAQDAPHPFVPESPGGPCAVCGLARSYKRHTEDWTDGVSNQQPDTYDLVGMSPTELVDLIGSCVDQKRALSLTQREAEHELAAKVGHGRHELDGAVFEVKTSNRRTKWDHEGLWAAVRARARDERRLDEATGEIEPEAETLLRVLGECMSPSWKVTGLRERGLDPDEWCQTDRGVSVRIYSTTESEATS